MPSPFKYCALLAINGCVTNPATPFATDVAPVNTGYEAAISPAVIVIFAPAVNAALALVVVKYK